MSYIGGSMYDVETCPECGALMWNVGVKTRIASTTGIPKQTRPIRAGKTRDEILSCQPCTLVRPGGTGRAGAGEKPGKRREKGQRRTRSASAGMGPTTFLKKAAMPVAFR